MPTKLSQRVWIRRNIAVSACAAAVYICLLFVQAAAAATSAVEVVKNGTNQVISLLKENPANAQVRREGIRSIVDNYFDFAEMGKRALGPHWRTLSAQQRQDFTQVFSQFLFNRYIDGIEKYTNERISYSQNKLQGNYALVEAAVTGGEGGPVVLDYHLLNENGTWKVYDVEIEGVDLIANYRSQFNSILASNSFNDLMRRLKEKNAAHAHA